MPNTNWKVQPYIRNRVDSEAEDSEMVTPKTETDDFKKVGERSMLFCYATRTCLFALSCPKNPQIANNTFHRLKISECSASKAFKY